VSDYNEEHPVISIFSPDHELHDPSHQLLDGALIPVFEAPARASIIHAALERAALGPILPPHEFDLAPIRAVHDEQYLDYLEHGYARWVAAGGSPAGVLPDTLAVRWMSRACAHPLAAPGYYAFDLSAPIVAGTYRAARASAAVALTGAALLREGQRAVYALCRPPGHHAGSDMCGGYCFLNNAAIAAQYLLSTTDHRLQTTEDGGWRMEDGGWKIEDQSSVVGRRSSIAILDIDFHHGNGTQQIFYERDDVLFVSIHADPARQYPYFSGYTDERGAGAGLGYNLNLPLETGVTDARFLEVLEQALAAVAEFAPRFLVLSAGVDTFGEDPVARGDFALTAAAYPAIGRRIAALGLPTLIVQEGGYAIAALGENVVGLLRGFIGD
jgi:acetoin utilization deacetylase AcuC-like enzyme